jgi:dihydropteroate synthase
MMLRARDRVLELARPAVMGILNLTPDSFFEGSRCLGNVFDPDVFRKRAREMVAAGAVILDLGAESSRPGALAMPTDIQLARLLPALEALRDLEDLNDLGILISVDTTDPKVMAAVLGQGAHLINDIGALRAPDALAVVSDYKAGAVLMHIQGVPETMQKRPVYSQVCQEVRDFLEARIEQALRAGIDLSQLVVDPGFGFGKRWRDHQQLMRGLASFSDVHPLGVPVLVGLSRKSVVSDAFRMSFGASLPVEERLPGSLALAALAVMQGARIIRTHDVKETVQAIGVVDSILEKCHKESPVI